MSDGISPELAKKVLEGELKNSVQSVADGGTLPAPIRQQIQARAVTPELAKQARAASLIRKWSAGSDLTDSQWLEIEEVYPEFAAENRAAKKETPSGPSLELTPEPSPSKGDCKITRSQLDGWKAVYKKEHRQLRRWITTGRMKGDPCPLDNPELMPAWWDRNMTWRVPPEIEQAAAAAVPVALPPPNLPATSPASAAAVDDESDKQVVPAPGKSTPINLEDFDPEDGDRLRELKRIQSARFDELSRRLKAGEDCAALETKYLKLCETIDKIETRSTARLKKMGLYILKQDVERDLAATCEMLRQMSETMERRVLENCPSLNEAQQLEVMTAIAKARAAEARTLSRLDCLTNDDLLRDLTAA